MHLTFYFPVKAKLNVEREREGWGGWEGGRNGGREGESEDQTSSQEGR